MTTAAIEQTVLHLPLQERAHLAHLLLVSLDEPSKAENRQLWAREAQRRADEIDEGKVQLVSGDDMEREGRAILERSSEDHHAHP